MVDMCMAKYDGIDGFGIKWKRILVAFFVLTSSLDKAAVKQYACITGRYQMAGTGHFIRSAEYLYCYWHGCCL